MKNLSKLTALLSAAAMTLSLAACSGGNAASTPAPVDTSTPTDTAAPSEGATYTVGICQLVTHDALDAATQGFMDALNEALPGHCLLYTSGRCCRYRRYGCTSGRCTPDGRGAPALR